MVFNSSTSGFHPESPVAIPGPRSISTTDMGRWSSDLQSLQNSAARRDPGCPCHFPAKLNLAYKRLVEAQEDSVQLRGPGPFPSRLAHQTRCASPATSQEVARDDRTMIVRSGQLCCRNGQPAAGLIRRPFSVQLGVLHPSERSLEARHSAWDRDHAGASPAVPTTFECGVV